MNRSARKFADKVALVTSGSSGLGLLTWVAVPLITRALHSINPLTQGSRFAPTLG